ncbi:MAG: glycosyltransferase, partial [Cyclobacteriaceae bacterium]|nr:glycosyltransferase [Cyclobacteriaceae bacterium]
MVSAKTVTKKESDKGEKQDYGHSLLVEIAWEVCNQVGGIYTVIRSKVPSVTRKKKDDYLLIGPLLNQDVSAEFEDISRPLQYGIYGKAVKTMRAKGYEVRFGRWLVTGRPLVILINPLQGFEQLQTIKDHLYKDHGIAHRNQDDLYHQVLAFSHLVTLFFEILNRKNREKRHVIAHFHEWMTVASVFSLARKRWPLKTIFTTHATLLGRYIAMNDKEFYKKLPNYDWEKEAEKYDILAVTQLERKGAECCDVFTTVSEVTSLECKHLLGREADWVLPNGLNIKRFAAYHEVQNMHQEFKEEIHEFVMGHFFQSYSFNLDKTLYFFTSGRYEFLNKGFDLTLEALKIL